MDIDIIRDYPTVESLRIKAKKNIPEFAFDYLDGGCNNEENLNRNIQDLKEIILEPKYLRNYKSSSQKQLFLGLNMMSLLEFHLLGFKDLYGQILLKF